METICLVRKDTTLQEPCVEAVGMGGYLLIRIGLDVDWNRWFDISLEMPKADKSGGTSIEEYCRNNRYVQDSLRALAHRICSLPEPDGDIHLVYDGKIAWLGQPEMARESIMARMWQEYFPIPEFGEYGSPEWMEQLIPETLCPNVLILGNGLGVCKVLEKHARKIKEVRWILFREDYDEVFRNFVEEFYSDYGLAIRYHVITDVSYLAEEGVRCTERTTVFDFTGPLYVNVKKMAPGSTWLDVYSCQTKWEQIRPFSEGAKRTCEYRSLYKMWTEMQKKYNRPYFLDSIEENGYNTLETVGARGYKGKEQR